MGNATLLAWSVTPADPHGRRYWAAVYDATNYNSTGVMVPITACPFVRLAQRTVGVEGIQLSHSGTVGATIQPTVYAEASIPMTLKRQTTTAAVDADLIWDGFERVTSASAARGASYLAGFSMAGYAATDDLVIYMRGWLE